MTSEDDAGKPINVERDTDTFEAGNKSRTYTRVLEEGDLALVVTRNLASTRTRGLKILKGLHLELDHEVTR